MPKNTQKQLLILLRESMIAGSPTLPEPFSKILLPLDNLFLFIHHSINNSVPLSFSSLDAKQAEGYFSQYSLTNGEGATPISCNLLFSETSSATSSSKLTVWLLQTLEAKAEALIQRLFSRVSSLETSPHRQTSAPRILLLSTPSGNTVKPLYIYFHVLKGPEVAFCQIFPFPIFK